MCVHYSIWVSSEIVWIELAQGSVRYQDRTLHCSSRMFRIEYRGEWVGHVYVHHTHKPVCSLCHLFSVNLSFWCIGTKENRFSHHELCKRILNRVPLCLIAVLLHCVSAGEVELQIYYFFFTFYMCGWHICERQSAQPPALHLHFMMLGTVVPAICRCWFKSRQ